LNQKSTYDCLEGLVAHVAGVWPVVAVHFEVFTHMRDALEEFATLSTLVLAFRRVHRQVLVQRVLCCECLSAQGTLVWSLS